MPIDNIKTEEVSQEQPSFTDENCNISQGCFEHSLPFYIYYKSFIDFLHNDQNHRWIFAYSD